MDKSIEEYVQRILGYVDDSPLNILESTPGVLRGILNGIDGAQLQRRPAPDEWSVAEVLAHLADSELVASFRVRKIISEPGCAVAAYDQRAWSDELGYAQQPHEHSLRLFTAVRQANVDLYKRLTPEQWKRYGIHSERGQESVEQLVKLLAGHDRNHVAQIKKTLERIKP